MKQRYSLAALGKCSRLGIRHQAGQVMAEYLIMVVTVSVALYLVLIRGGEFTIGEGQPWGGTIDVPSVTEALADRETTYRHVMYMPLTSAE